MAYVNCALCPAQALLYGHHQYSDGDAYAEFRCVSGHKTFVEEKEIDGDTRATDERSRAGTSTRP